MYPQDLRKKFQNMYIEEDKTDSDSQSSGLSILERIKPRPKKGQDYARIHLDEQKLARGAKNSETLKDETVPGVNDLEDISTLIDITDIHKDTIHRIRKEYYQNKETPVSNLIISSYKKKILSLVETNQVTIITGPTGCGKSTQVPQFILDSSVEKNKYCNIIVTQPRRIAAISIARRVCDERNWELGKLCGYKVGLKGCVSDDTLLTYMTVGVLLQHLIKTKNMTRFTHIFLDEIHERDQFMDFALIVIKKLLSATPNTKIILMSATVEATKFAKYFQHEYLGEAIYAPILQIEQATKYPVQIHYLDELSALGDLPDISVGDPRVSDAAVEICIRLIKQIEKIDNEASNKNSILIFLPGIYEIEHLYMKLTDPKIHTIATYNYKWCPLPLHSSITVEEQAQVFLPAPSGCRKIILSTNLAESSITVPGVKFVIDFCLTKRLKNDPCSNFTSLQICWASQANCIQRAGRVGRVMEGRVYRMVPKNFYEKFEKEAPPEMLDSPLDRVVLQSKLLDMGEPKAILALALDPPDLTNIEWTILTLKEAGGLLRTRNGIVTPFDGDLTFLGRLMAILPVDIHITRLIIMGYLFSCFPECIIIGACMSLKSVFSHPFRHRLKAYNSKLDWADGSCSDCMALLNMYEVWSYNHRIGYFKRSVGDNESAWAKRHFIQLRVLKEVKLLVEDITERLKDNRIEEPVGIGKVLWSDYEKTLILKVAIAGAFYPNYFGRGVSQLIWNELSEEQTAVKMLGGRNPFTTVILHNFPLDQPAELYSELIKKELSDCAEEMRITSNHHSKIYVEFRQGDNAVDYDSEFPFDGKIPGKIPMAVYRAVKTRHLKKPINIRLLPPEEARKRAESLGIQMKTYVGGEEVEEKNFKMIPCPLPGVDVSCIPLTISHVIDPGHFWAYDTDGSENQRKLYEIINSTDRKHKSLLKLPSVGDICIAPFAEYGETSLYRARVVSVKGGPNPRIKLFYVDFGNYGMVGLDNLKDYGPELIELVGKIPALAFECVLSELRPSLVVNSIGKWSEKAEIAFHRITQGGQLLGSIYSVVNGILSIELLKVDEKNSHISINEYLINEGYAEKVEEHYLSRMNHILRKERVLNPDQKNAYNNNQKRDAWPVDSIEPPAAEDCKISVQLKGPTSPLEMTLTSYMRAILGKSVQISDESVNSVLLDGDPHDPHEILVVAGFVNQNFDGSRLILNNTTIMPNIRGFAAIIPLIFAPEIEFRVNEERTKYVGMLCGLGTDGEGEPLFPEHDMEINFDCEITYEDFTQVNILRYYMSLLLMTEEGEEFPNLGNSEVIEYQRKIRTSLLNLLTKERKSMAVEISTHDFKWGCVKSDLVADSLIARSYNELSIFPFHPGVSLVSDI